MISVSVLVPFRPDRGERDRIWAWNRQRWEQTMPDAELVVCTDGGADGQPFNEGKAWNRCAKRATGEILVITESEVVASAADLKPVIETCYETGGWFVPQTYVQLSAMQTQNVLALGPTAQLNDKLAKFADRVFRAESVSPVWVLPREALDKVGGFDERYQGWGWIDKAFAAAMNTLYEPVERFAGTVWHLHHSRTTSSDCNPLLTGRYLAANGDVLAMRALVNER